MTADSDDLHSYDNNRHSSETHGSFSRPNLNSNRTNATETEQTDENFNSFRYWRSPLPDISGELEMLNCHTTREEAKSTEKIKEEQPQQGIKEEEEPDDNFNSDLKSSSGRATSDQIQKVLDCLQPHINDPDVQGGHHKRTIKAPIRQVFECKDIAQVQL